MNSRRVSITRVVVLICFLTGTIAPCDPMATMPLMACPPMPSPQAAQSCVEDFTSDTDPSMAGFASSVFSHSITGNFQLGNAFPGDPPGHSLALFAGATDVITFPGQTVTFARVSIFDFGVGFVIFEGTGGIKTEMFHPLPFTQIKEASDTTIADNDMPLGQIVKMTLIGFETLFDNIEISPCMSAPPTTTVDLFIRPGSINPRRNDGLMKVVILSSSAFDAGTVDPATVQFGSATVPFRHFIGDEDEDGDTDLIFFFLVGDVGILCGDTTVRLTGMTTSGQSIEGEGAIQTVGCP